MKINVCEDGKGIYSVSFDDEEVKLDARDLKELLIQASEVLSPTPAVSKRAEADRRVFMARLSGADDVGMQAFIQTAGHDDIVVLLKVSEDDSELREKLIRNMSETNRKIFLEDVDFKFQQDAVDTMVRAAFVRLERVVEELEADGMVLY